MWADPQNDLNDYLKVSNTLQIKSLVIAEWNMNNFATLRNYGTYRWRRPGSASTQYYNLINEYIESDPSDHFTDANKSIYTFGDFVNKDDEPVIFEADEVRRSLYYDLKECFQPFRPRSGINKPLYLDTYIANIKSAKRPRYYMASRYDNFKYWNSYRTQLNDTRGRLKYTVSNKQLVGTTATLTISTHALKVGDSVDIYGVHELLDGSYTLNAVTATTVSYGISSASTITSSSAAGSLYLDVAITEYGVSLDTNPNGNDSIGYYIEDTAPFVVYEDKFAANRIVVKMQTNMADVDSTETFINKSGIEITNPYTDINQSSIPKRWKIQYLDEDDKWIDAISFNENSIRSDGTSIVPWDGHVEISYGIKFPSEFRQSFRLIDSSLTTTAQLPTVFNNEGHAYIVGQTSTNPGTLYVWKNLINDWISVPVQYGFDLVETDDTKNIGIVTKLIDPEYVSNNIGIKSYKEVVFIRGLRVGVETMYAPGKTFDLIELSPRLRANISDYVESYSTSKNVSNDSTGLPVGGLLASNGTITIMNYDGSFTENNILIGINSASLKNIKTYQIPVEGSIVSQYLKINVKFDIYEAVLNVDGYDKFIPIKTMYAETFPIFTSGMNSMSITLRDLFFRLETTRATPMFFTEITLTAAVAMLLDSIGFSNYVFLGFDERESIKIDNQEFYASIQDPVIPYFFVHPDVSIAQALIDLATSFQAAMFFDEYNNFVMMPKEYLIPETNKRSTSWTLYGQSETVSGLITLPNIIDISGGEAKILNDGILQYTTRYIQKDVSSLQQARYIDDDKTFNYKPVLLWEVGANQATKTINQANQTTSGFSLSAVPLNTNLSSTLPTVVNNQIIDNTINIGENVIWLGRFQGYLYANGEVIRYDAIEYNVPVSSVNGSTNDNKVWISSNQEYQKYFASLKFGGKIFPTGLVRIYVEPYYEERANNTNRNIVINILNNAFSSGNLTQEQFKNRLKSAQEATTLKELQQLVQDLSQSTLVNLETVVPKNGIVKRHGRGQFGTTVVEHQAGLSDYWSSDNNVRCCRMNSELLFTTTPTTSITRRAEVNPITSSSSAGVVTTLATGSTRNGIIKNFMRATLPSDDVVRKLKTAQSATIQSSALVFSGVQNTNITGSASATLYPASSNKRDFIFYTYKELNNEFRHFGTRLRILGKTKVGESFQLPRGSFEYFNEKPDSSDKKISIEGGSAGIAFGLNPSTNVGYYFEITSLTLENLQQFQNTNQDTGAEVSVLHNVNFYKIVPSTTTVNGTNAMPVKLWGGLGQILVDEGLFVGMDRVGTDKPTVYDLSVEYENVGNKRVFYLYLNGAFLQRVEDPKPIPEYNNMALFVRGSSEVMFENIYALQNIISKNIGETIGVNASDAFGIGEISSIAALRKYGLSGFIQASYLSNISSTTENKIKIYFEEFGTILRECMYFNVRYDKAYPALISEIAPTASSDRGYTVSGFQSGSYGAEFMIFNNADKTIVLDESTGNFLRILGITFTQDTSAELSVDSFFKERSNFSDPLIIDSTIYSPITADKIYESIKTSRQRNGKREFSINPIYIQNEDMANDLMQWLVNKTLRERKSFTIETFGTPHLQLGDIININYNLPEGVDLVDPSKQFIISGIETSRSQNNLQMTLKVVEV